MEHSIQARWTHDLCFDAEQQEHVIKLKSSTTPDEVGFSPKRLLLTALAGCSGMDIASLLPKMRVPFTSIVISVRGTLAEDHPKSYTHIHVTYEIGASEEYREQVERAVELSETKYCGVSAMLRKAATITHDIVLAGA